MLMPMPVLPRMTAPGIQPPLGVLSKMLPARSMIAMWVVSFTAPDTGSASGNGELGLGSSAIFATQYFHSLTVLSDGGGLPATTVRLACIGWITLVRSFAYSF